MWWDRTLPVAMAGVSCRAFWHRGRGRSPGMSGCGGRVEMGWAGRVGRQARRPPVSRCRSTAASRPFPSPRRVGMWGDRSWTPRTLHPAPPPPAAAIAGPVAGACCLLLAGGGALAAIKAGVISLPTRPPSPAPPTPALLSCTWKGADRSCKWLALAVGRWRGGLLAIGGGSPNGTVAGAIDS